MDIDQFHIAAWLEQAKKGETKARQSLLDYYRPFVIRVVRQVCKRYVDWHQDEASIGLMALNEAIERYKPDEGKTFENYARLVIRSRLLDHFRTERRWSQQEIVLDFRQDDEVELSMAEISSSLESYSIQQSANILAEELTLYDTVLKQFGILLEELEDESPDHQDTRRRLIEIAHQFCDRPDHVVHLHKTKQLPLKEMLLWVDVSRKTLERNRKYLIALIIIYSSQEFSHIRSTISFADLRG
jgi:RNA polymerase sigma factor